MTDLMNTAEAVNTHKNPYRDQRSIEFGFRARRFVHVRSMIETILAERGTCDILDLGGTETYWLIGGDFLDANRHRIRIVLLNPQAEPARDPSLFRSMPGDATEPGLLEGKSFDLVHSNSVIEHVGDDQAMRRFADNVRRLGRRYFVQTPSFWFPYEPHFRVPGFQFLPAAFRRELLRRVRLGFFPPVPDAAEAQSIVDHHRLVSTRQMRRFFPDAAIRHETVLGLNKSIMAMRHAAPVTVRTPLAAPPLAPSINDLYGSEAEETLAA